MISQIEKTGYVDFLENAEVESLSYFIYHDYDEEKINWKRPENGFSHADCRAHAVAEKKQLEAKGYLIMTGELAVMAREGKLTVKEVAKLI